MLACNVCMCVCVVNVIGVSLCVEKPIEDFVSLVTRKAIPIMERESVCVCYDIAFV